TTLSYLYREKTLFPSALAEMSKIRKQSMTQVLQRLEELKLIRRVVTKEDKRKAAISLTAYGKKMIEKTRYERDEWLAGAIREVVGEEGMKVLAAAVPMLQRIADVK
ncbi:MAG TPA: MarR family transcriptional regulator, partial [Puia sp.]|nr:MarR family transcriptional regulator [Puia sp.]